jgi:hypothetical protein
MKLTTERLRRDIRQDQSDVVGGGVIVGVVTARVKIKLCVEGAFEQH